MVEHRDEDLSGSRFERVRLAGAVFDNCDLSGAVVTNSLLLDVTIDGLVERLTVYGVDVMPLVNGELDRRTPSGWRLCADVVPTARRPSCSCC